MACRSDLGYITCLLAPTALVQTTIIGRAGANTLSTRIRTASTHTVSVSRPTRFYFSVYATISLEPGTTRLCCPLLGCCPIWWAFSFQDPLYFRVRMGVYGKYGLVREPAPAFSEMPLRSGSQRAWCSCAFDEETYLHRGRTGIHF